MLTGFWISKSFRKTEVNNIDKVLLLAYPDQKVVWLNIPMQEMPRMDEF